MAGAGVRVVSDPVHLLAAGEAFRVWSTAVAVCGEPVTTEVDGGEEPHYCPDCVREAIRWCAQS